MEFRNVNLRFGILLAVILFLLWLVCGYVLSGHAKDQQALDNALTGNWASETPGSDGYVRKSYFNLKQEGDKITGTIRATQFFYTIKESTGGSDGFTLTASMIDGKSERKVTYEGKFVNGELIIGRRNRPDQPVTLLPAYRVP